MKMEVYFGMVFPDLYRYFDSGEKDYEHAMEYSEISPVRYSQDVYSVEGKLNDLRAASERRTASNPLFKQVEKHAKWLKSQRDIDIYSLNLDKYKSFEKEQDAVSDKFEKIMDNKVEGLIVKNLRADMSEVSKDEGAEARNKDWIEGLEKDIYINEVLSILADMN